MNKRAVISFVLVISTLFAFNPGAVTFADDGALVSIDVSDAALQLTVPQSASIELNPTSSSAVFGSTNLTIGVATNNMTGYRIIMSVPTTDLVHSSLSNTVIPTLSSSASEIAFPANAWGYKVVDDNYEPVLVSNTPAAWIVEEPTNGTNHIMTLAAKVDGLKPSGAYINTLTFQAVANPNAPKDTIVFNGNGSDGGSMTSQVMWQGEPTKLSSNSFTKTGYAFNGWNTAANGNGVGYGDGDYYTSPVTNAATTINLYAQWICDRSVNTCDGVPSVDTGGTGGYAGKTLQDAYEMAYVTNPGLFPDGGGTKHGLYVPEKDPTTGEYNGIYHEATSAAEYEGIPANDLRFAMQDIDLEINGVKVCDYATVPGSEAYVLDLRDYKSYWITKLKDGKCWMTQNLDFNIPVGGMTSELSDLNSAGSLGYVDGYSQDPDTGVITYMPIRGTGNVESYVKTTSSPYSSDIGDRYQICTSGSCPQSFSDTPGGLYGEHGHLGNYYNWTAAAASNESSAFNTGSSSVYARADNSICPQGWRLPIITGTTVDDGVDEISMLWTAYGLLNSNSWAFSHEPFYFVYSGQVNQDVGTMWSTWKGFHNGEGSSGGYWSGEYRNYFDYDYSANVFDIMNGSITTTKGRRRYFGYGVRCVAR